MFVSEIDEKDLSAQLIDRLLFAGIRDTGEAADCILVLGSMKAAQYRVPVAAGLYHAGRAGKIMLCGGKVRDFPDGQYSEAQYMHKAALELGICEDALILENRSQNTAENLRFAQELLQHHCPDLQRIILVTTAYHMRRSLTIARQLFPMPIAIIPCPANDTHTRRDNWMLSPVGTQRATGEARKIIHYVKAGMLPDFEI